MLTYAYECWQIQGLGHEREKEGKTLEEARNKSIKLQLEKELLESRLVEMQV
jgi:hypothetical protein